MNIRTKLLNQYRKHLLSKSKEELVDILTKGLEIWDTKILKTLVDSIPNKKNENARP